MKNTLLTLTLMTLTLVSCGPSAEEIKALETLQSREESLTYELEDASMSMDFWFNNFQEETDDLTKSLYGDKYTEASNKYDQVKKELGDVQVEISKLK
jgi:hypothetical protein